MLTLEQAQRELLSLGHPLPTERVGLDSAVGRVLRNPVRALREVPGADLSTMDGYAVAASSLGSATDLPLQPGEGRPGRSSPPLHAGYALRIFTGAPLPVGADAVVMQEEAAREGDQMHFRRPVVAGQHVRRRGEELSAGQLALEPGALLTPARVALAAALDQVWLTVSQRPQVTIVPTGDELREAGQYDGSPRIVESNGGALAALARGLGCDARVAPVVADDLEATKAAFDVALERTDVLLTIGGVSVGDYDHVRAALEGVGVRIAFHHVAVKPGKPLLVGSRGRTVVVGLPGNPASALISFAQLVAPALRALQGRSAVVVPSWPARLAHPVQRTPGRLELARATLERRPGEQAPYVRLLAHQASGAWMGMAQATHLARLPADRATFAEGEWVDVDAWSELVS